MMHKISFQFQLINAWLFDYIKKKKKHLLIFMLIDSLLVTTTTHSSACLRSTKNNIISKITSNYTYLFYYYFIHQNTWIKNSDVKLPEYYAIRFSCSDYRYYWMFYRLEHKNSSKKNLWNLQNHKFLNDHLLYYFKY